MPQPLENFATPITHNFIEPDVAIDIHEERPFRNADRLRVLRHDWIHQVIPHFKNLKLGLFPLEAQPLEHAGNEVANRLHIFGEGPLGMREIDPAEFRQDRLLRRELDARR